jgi:DNA invertase Pin-like site-specific DNA recombinase
MFIKNRLFIMSQSNNKCCYRKNMEDLNEKSVKRSKVSNDYINDICNNFDKQYINDTNAIIYCRVSTKNQTFGTSIDSQKTYCQDYCSQNNLNIKSIIIESKSAKSMNTQKQLNIFIGANKNINLVVYEPTRLSRNLKDFIQFNDNCNKQNIKVHCVNDCLVSSNNLDFKEILSRIVDGEIESKNIGIRVKRSINYRKLKGTYKSSIPTYGIKYIKSNGKIQTVPNTEEHKIIDLIQKLYWGSEIKLINKLLVEITGTPQQLYYITNPEKSIEKIEYGNMRLVDIVNFLNSIPITRRNKKWNSNTISQIVK